MMGVKTTVAALRDAISTQWTKIKNKLGLTRPLCCSVNPIRCSKCGKAEGECIDHFFPELPITNGLDAAMNLYWRCKRCRNKPHMNAFNSVIGSVFGR